MDNTAPKISIIIPAYNVELYISDLLDCVLRQTMQDYEVIIVNDGSTDNTQAVINEYRRHFNSLKIILQPNAGLSAARNVAMKAAKGSYYAFLDADDLITDDYLEKLYLAAEKNDAELVKCSISDFYDSVDNARLVSDAEERMAIFPENLKISLQNSPCAGIVRSEFLKRLNISFSVGERMEDSPYGIAVNILANKTAVVKESLYFHRIGRPQSIMTEVGLGKGDPKIPYNGMRATALLLRENIKEESVRNAAEFIIANTFACFLTTMYKNYDSTIRKKLCSYCNDYIKEFYPNICKNQYVMKTNTYSCAGIHSFQREAVKLFALSYKFNCMYLFSSCVSTVLRAVDKIGKK